MNSEDDFYFAAIWIAASLAVCGFYYHPWPTLFSIVLLGFATFFMLLLSVAGSR